MTYKRPLKITVLSAYSRGKKVKLSCLYVLRGHFMSVLQQEH